MTGISSKAIRISGTVGNQGRWEGTRIRRVKRRRQGLGGGGWEGEGGWEREEVNDPDYCPGGFLM